MRVVETVAELLEARRVRGDAVTGFVPTMGALHDAHRALLERARRECAQSWASVFVNPAQFDDPGDLARYPRTREADLDLLREAGTDLVFLPRAEELYADGYRYRVTETGLSRRLEGASRPGHFDGVLTVVLKLLLLTRPARAYFGEKDWQQLRLVEGLARAFFLDVEVVPCALGREADGLAMSSRNRLLSPAERATAPALHRVLAESVRERHSAAEAASRLAQAGFGVDYVEDEDGRRLAAVRLGKVRLIDNVAID
ncbi:MAG: pantoate--beta-alanine ligase [Gammaproteobacteria bacterium]